MVDSVTLSKYWVKICEWIGRHRAQDFIDNPPPYLGKFSRESDTEINIEGVCAEKAFGMVFGVDMPLGVGKDAEDTVIQGVRVDVKAATRPTDHLIVSEEKAGHPADEYCLMIGHRPDYRFAGCISATDVFQDKYHRTGPGRRPGYWIPQADLHAPSFVRNAA